jgi:hypothetical protein
MAKTQDTESPIVQLGLSLGPQSFTQRANKISRQASKRRRLPILQPSLLADSGFSPIEGVPATRADCPSTAHAICPHVRCRHHLLLEDAEHRAGRPGLASVPRDERGLTLPSSGNAGAERPGTTLRPGWLRVRGLELEREVKVYVTWEVGGYTLHEVRNGTLDYWLKYVHPGELVHAFSESVTIGQTPVMHVADVIVKPDRTIAFDRALPTDVVNGYHYITLKRVRPVASCALDEIDRRGKMSNEQAGEAIARHRTLVGREAREALKKACRAAEELGMSVDDFLAGLKELGSGQ